MTILMRRRDKRGRPRKDEKAKKIDTIPVFVCRDPQGIKLFKKKPTLEAGLWEGQLLDINLVEPKQFIAQFRNARLPARGQMFEMKMGINDDDQTASN